MDIEQPEPPVHPAAMLAPVCLGSGLVYQLDMEVLKKEQFADSDLRRVMKKLLGERSDDRDERFSLYAARLLEFSLKDGVLMYTREVCDGRQPRAVPVIPSSLKDRMLYEAHELQGHQGLQVTRCWLQSRCYWLDMEDDVRLHLYCCSKCFPSTTDSEGEEPYRPAMMATLASFVLDDSSARPVVAGNVSGVRPVIPSALVTASEEWSKEDIRLRQDEDDVIRLVKERLQDQQPFGRAAMRDPLFRPYHCAEVGSPLSAVQGEAPVYWVAQDRGNPLGSPAIPVAPSVAAPSVRYTGIDACFGPIICDACFDTFVVGTCDETPVDAWFDAWFDA
ncbi:hypothetical protein FOZ62_026696 [Perkinsus olseni]|uniref:Integrase zinc-binding domain-containing protein n=1 Tax=Perkinsus olseni TaxID=32597 RepID=A0A7J6RHJ4_PEROL|nr:hypothetical protein FOZ62_026696 [Perkinsus olseni]